MKLHETVIKKLLRLYDLHGGRRDNSRLTQEIRNLDLSAYTRQNNQQVLVITEELEAAKLGLPR